MILLSDQKKAKHIRALIEDAENGDTTTDDEIEGGLFYTSPHRKKSKTPRNEGQVFLFS